MAKVHVDSNLNWGSTDETPRQVGSKTSIAPGDVEMENDKAKARKEAEALKTAGGDTCKKGELEQAAKNYQQASLKVTSLTNLAYLCFKEGKHDEVIETYEKADEEGRSLRADFKLTARAYGQLGASYQERGDLLSAIKNYHKSLTERHTPDILNKLKEAVKLHGAEADRRAYINPKKSAIAREKGNAKFKAGDSGGAIKYYGEAIERDPADARAYNERAIVYIKEGAFLEALKDVNKAIEVEPSFVSAYFLKVNVHISMREYTEALETVQEAELHDKGNRNAAEIQQLISKIQMAALETHLARAPEVASVMSDPIHQILQRAQSDPTALQDRKKNPTMKAKCMKSGNAGVIRTEIPHSFIPEEGVESKSFKPSRFAQNVQNVFSLISKCFNGGYDWVVSSQDEPAARAISNLDHSK